MSNYSITFYQFKAILIFSTLKFHKHPAALHSLICRTCFCLLLHCRCLRLIHRVHHGHWVDAFLTRVHISCVVCRIEGALRLNVEIVHQLLLTHISSWWSASLLSLCPSPSNSSSLLHLPASVSNQEVVALRCYAAGCLHLRLQLVLGSR